MKGIYCLHLKIGKKIGMKVGSLGFVYFPKGNYIYVGSAQNSLEKRILRHFSKSKKIRWHIDYLLKSRWVKIKKVFYKIADKSEECKTATLLFKFGTAIKKFGCSDCKCFSHLFKIENKIVEFLLKKGFKEFNFQKRI